MFPVTPKQLSQKVFYRPGHSLTNDTITLRHWFSEKNIQLVANELTFNRYINSMHMIQNDTFPPAVVCVQILLWIEDKFTGKLSYLKRLMFVLIFESFAGFFTKYALYTFALCLKIYLHFFKRNRVLLGNGLSNTEQCPVSHLHGVKTLQIFCSLLASQHISVYVGSYWIILFFSHI